MAVRPNTPKACNGSSKKLTVSRADRVWMEMIAAYEIPGARQAQTWGQVSAEDTQDNLDFQLLGQTNPAGVGEPELHGALS